MNTLLTIKLAHDLENILNIMAQCVRSIRTRMRIRGESDSELDIADLDAAIDSAFAVSQELMTLERPPAAEPPMIDVNELVTQARRVIQRMLGIGIDLSLDLRATDPLVQVEVVQFEWLLLNLVANARDAMPAGGVLTIETASTEGAPDMPSDSNAYRADTST